MAFPSNWTGFDPSKGTFAYHLWATPDLAFKVYPIAANALSENPDWYENDEDVSGKTAEQKNRISLICQLDYANQTYVICGDATNTTMAAVNNLFKGGTTIFDNNRMTTLPHHGSRRTAFAVSRDQQPTFGAFLTVLSFANLLKSHLVTDSAYEKHRHPSLQLMSMFIPTIKVPLIQDPRLHKEKVHFATAYFDMEVLRAPGFIYFIFSMIQQSFETQTNTFTTRYFDGWFRFYYDLGLFNQISRSNGAKTLAPINGFASWVFLATSKGEFGMFGVPALGKPAFTEYPPNPVPEAAPSPALSFVAGPRPPAIQQTQFHHRIRAFR
jgi:hypothetical protein